jgi:hypothetical protein
MNKLPFLLIIFAATVSAQVPEQVAGNQAVSDNSAKLAEHTSQKDAAKDAIDLVLEYAPQAEKIASISPTQARRTRQSYFLDFSQMNEKLVRLNQSSIAKFGLNDPNRPLAACGNMTDALLTYWTALTKGQNSGGNGKRFMSNTYKTALTACRQAIDKPPE